METKEGRENVRIIGVFFALIHFLALIYMLNSISSDSHGFIYLGFAGIDFPITYAAHVLQSMFNIKIGEKPLFLIFGTIWWYFVPAIIYKSYIVVNFQVRNFNINVKQGNISLKKWGAIFLALLIIGISLL